MATPNYQGQGQPTLTQDSGGVVARLGSMFGSTTPMYQGVGQPSMTTGQVGAMLPAYAPAATPQENTPTIIAASQQSISVADLAELTAALAAGHVVIVVPRAAFPIDPAALAAGQIAIVVPRGTCVSDGSADTATE